MGRYNFRAAKVHQATARLLNTPVISSKPSWFDAVGSIPPSQILVRTLPVQHKQTSHRKGKRKASKLFRPQNIEYKEDRLRQTFYQDHPWELARPRVVLEDDGVDYQKANWERIRQPHLPLNGESVVQRQLFLMRGGMPRNAAYDQARKEFYQERLEEDVARRVAKEEAQSAGAYFTKTNLQIGAELEQKAYEEWRKWAADNVSAANTASLNSVVSSSELTAGETEGAEDAEKVER